MKVLLSISVLMLSFALQGGEGWSAELIPEQSVTFRATFESRKEAQEYLSAFFRTKGYHLKVTNEGLHILYVGLPNGQNAVAHGVIQPGASVCVLIDLYSEELRTAIEDRSPASRARMASEAADLVGWLKSAGAQSIQQLAARPWDERSKCLGARSNTSLERTRGR